MKKLMFATALVASAAAFADPTALNAISFEGYSADATFANGAAEKGEDGNDKSPGPFFYYDGDADGSSVKTFATGDAGAMNAPTRPFYFQGITPAANYLELSTEGGTLWRSINPISSTTVGEDTTYGLGTGEALADGIYLDTLVQFTPTEDGGAPELDGADKLAIWLNVDSNQQTNLQVKAAVIDLEGAPLAPTTFTITNKSVNAGQWYRLTVKAIPDIAGGEGVPGFQIKLDGQLLMSDTPTLTAGTISLLEGYTDYLPDIRNGAVFASLGGINNNPTLQGVGFKGSGALDDIVWTTDDLFAVPAGIDFTLTWPAGLTAVSYTIDGGEPVAISGASPLSIPNLVGGEAITFIVQNADGAQKTLSATAANGEGIDATGTTFGWPEYLGEAVAGAYEIDNLAELKLFQKGFAAGLPTANTTFKLTDDVTLTDPWPGVGTYDNTTNADAFEGVFDGAGHRISNVLFADNETGGNAASTANNYRGFFNQINGATIRNLTIQWNGWAPNVSTTEFGGAAIVGCANNSTLERLTAEGTVTAGTHNNAGIVVRASGLTAPTTISACTNKMALTGNYTKLAGICAITQAGTSTVTFDGCVNEGSITAVAVTGATNAGRDGVAGILGYAANGDGNTIINACVNTGTIDVSAGYSGTHSGYTGAKTGQLLGWANNSASLTGANTVGTGLVAVGAYSANKTSGQNFATVSGTTATMIADADVVPGQTQYMAMTEKAAYQFAAAGTLIVDEALKAATVTVADESLTLTSATVGTVTTYTAAAAAGDDYEVVIDGSDVVITPQPEDFAAIEPFLPAGVTTNDVAAVNALLATPIEGTTIPAWQAMFLGVAPTTNGLETVAIKSVSFDAEGKVVVEMADGVTLKTGRGVTINLILKGSDDLSTWTTLQTATDTKAFTPVTPAVGETKKFYKVVVEFAGSNAQP